MEWGSLMKKVVVYLASAFLCFFVFNSLCITQGLAAEKRSSQNFSLIIDRVDYTGDAAAFIGSNGRTMVPIRFMAENMGCELEWDGDTRQAILTDIYNHELIFTVGKNKVLFNKEEATIDANAVIVNSRMYIPLSSLGVIGVMASWETQTRTVSVDLVGLIKKEIAQVKKLFPESRVYGYHLYCSTEGKNDLDASNCDFLIDTDTFSICLIDSNNLKPATVEALEKVLAIYFPTEKDEAIGFLRNALAEKTDGIKEFENREMRISHYNGEDRICIDILYEGSERE